MALPIAGIFSAIGGMASASAKTKQVKQQSKAIRAAADTDRALFGQQVEQMAAKANQEKGVRALQAEQHIGALNAMLAETGVVGNTHAALRNQIAFDRGLDLQTMNTNARNALGAAQAEFNSRMTNYQSQLNGTASSMPSAASGFLNSFASFMPDKSGNKMTLGDLGGSIGNFFKPSVPFNGVP
jgi:hypothetical protein